MSAWHDHRPPATGARVALWLLVGSVVLHLLSAVAIGYSNADRFHEGIWRSLPWTKGDCGNTWSVPAFLLVIVIAVGAALLARIARDSQHPAAARRVAAALYWIGLLQVGYWVLSTLGNLGGSCTGGQL